MSKKRNRSSGEFTKENDVPDTINTAADPEPQHTTAPPHPDSALPGDHEPVSAEVPRYKGPEPEPVSAVRSTAPTGAEAPAQPAVRVRPVVDPNAQVVVRPMRTVKLIRVGQIHLSFQKGVACKVPATAVDHLRRKGIIA